MKLSSAEAISDLAEVGVTPTEGVLERLQAFASILEGAPGGRFGNLMGPSETGRLWSRHFLESAAYLPFVKDSPSVVDVGTGGGFPGMVLALFGLPVTMVESRRKRYLFLLWARDEMGLSNARVVQGRVENCGPFPSGAAFTARAVEKPLQLLERIRAAVPGGFTLTVRSQDPYSAPGEKVITVLPSPPLDRPGFMVQFRHPGP